MPIRLELDNCTLSEFIVIAAHHDPQQYSYVITPNVDHLIRYYDDVSFRELYTGAKYVLMDSRFLAYLVRMFKGVVLPVCPGSDVTMQLFNHVIDRHDRLVLIGGDEAQAAQLQEKFRLTGLKHYNPPMGFIRDPQSVEACLAFIEHNSPFRFCFLAVGAPQQEMLATALKQRGRARGMALCIGASVNFITGRENRAPLWMQKTGTEWLYRLLQDPRRLARRYLVRGPRIFGLLSRFDLVLRPVAGKFTSVVGDEQSAITGREIY